MMPLPTLLLDVLSLVGLLSFLLSGGVALLPAPAGTATERAREARRRLLFPFVGAVTAVGLGFWPAIRAALGGASDHCPTAPSHHPHLCWLHPMGSGGAAHDAVVLVILATLGGLALWQALLWAQARGRLKLLQQVTRTPREAALRERLAELGLEWSGAVQVIAIGLPLCFVHGIRKPRLVMSELLLDDLPIAYFQAIVAHELAHVARRDNAWRAIGQLAVLTHLPGLGRRAYRRWSEATEAACDEEASVRVGSTILVAEALVHFQRLINQRGLADSPRLQAGAAFAERGGLEPRVRLLLEAVPPRPALFGYWPGVALVLAFWKVDTLHHALELLLGMLHG